MGISDNFERQMQKFLQKQLTETLPKVVREIATEVFLEVIDNSPSLPGSKYSEGQFINAWQIETENTRSKASRNRASGTSSSRVVRTKKGESSPFRGADAKVQKKNEIIAFMTGSRAVKFRIVNNLPYARKVEFAPGWDVGRDNKRAYRGESTTQKHGPYAPVRKARAKFAAIAARVLANYNKR